MSYRSHRSPRRTQAKPVVFGTYAMVLLDGTPLRKAAVSACKQARKTFEKAETELLEFERVDVPAYERWYRGTFGSLLQEKDQLERDLQRMQQRLERMMMLRLQTGCSGAEALEQAVREETEDSEDDEEMDEEYEAEFRRQQEQHRKQAEQEWKSLTREFANFLRMNAHKLRQELSRGRSIREVRESLLDYFGDTYNLPEMMLRVFSQREDVEALWVKHGLDLSLAPVDAKTESTESRIKRLMRELAFALHPDQCGVADERRLALWHQVQEAVKAKDLDRLEVLHAHMQLLQGDLGPGLSVGRIQELTANYRKSREALRRKIREFRKAVKWGFSKRTNDEKEQLRKVTELELKRSLSHIRSEVRQIERMVKEFEKEEEEDPDEWFLNNLFGM